MIQLEKYNHFCQNDSFLSNAFVCLSQCQHDKLHRVLLEDFKVQWREGKKRLKAKKYQENKRLHFSVLSSLLHISMLNSLCSVDHLENGIHRTRGKDVCCLLSVNGPNGLNTNIASRYNGCSTLL